MLPLRASRLTRIGLEVVAEPVADLLTTLAGHVHGDGPGGMVLLGAFGAGKSFLCDLLASAPTTGTPCTVVPLRDVARWPDVDLGLRKVVGPTRLAEAVAGARVLLLDGLDEVPRGSFGLRTWAAVFDALTTRVGPRWLLTSRPGFLCVDAAGSDVLAETLDRPDVRTLRVEPLDPDASIRAIEAMPRGRELLASVENLDTLATTPLLLHAVHAAMPWIEPGRPIEAWGVYDAWIRHGLIGGSDADVRMTHLEDLAWATWHGGGLTTAVPTFDPDDITSVGLPGAARRGLFVFDLDGRMRFGHRSVYEFLLAARVAPRLAANQGHGPDELSGIHISEAMRAFLIGRTGPMPVVRSADRTRIPRGNFVAGGDVSVDEQPLRIEHLARPFWIARAPVTHGQWRDYLEAHPDTRTDANYLPHWGPERRMPVDTEDVPIYGMWPEDADGYARRSGARLPSADEWEKAVRGIDGRRFPWGEAWRVGRACTAELGLDRPLPVRSLGAQGDAGLFDACGGVFEYTSSDWNGRTNRGRVVMGGAFTHQGRVSRPSLRLSHKLSGRLKAGLRLAWDVAPDDL
jgi:hypothetical protein